MGKNTIQAKQWLDKCYSDPASSILMVLKWFADLKRGHINTDDLFGSNSAVVPKKIHQTILAERKMKLRETANTVKTSEGSVLHSLFCMKI